jgi:hypothetical protein
MKLRHLRSSVLVFVAAASAIASGPSHAQPDPLTSACSLDARGRLLLIPDGLGDVPAASFTVTVLDGLAMPIIGSVVTVEIGGVMDGMTRICSDQMLTVVTGPGGVAAFNIGGGGCYKAAGAVEILADGVLLRSYDQVMSPDYTATDNAGIPGQASLTVTPGDFASFVAAFQGGIGPASCHDYNNDGRVSVPDFAVFAVSYKGGVNFCP